MNSTDAENFINSLVRNLQILCHSNVEFRNDIEVVGHLYLKVDKTKKFNYIVDEKVCKNDASSTMFVSNSYHSINHNKKAQTTEERTLSATVEQSQLPKTICSNINRSNSDQLAAQSFDDVEPPIKTKKLSHKIIDTQIMPVRPRDVVKRNQQHHHSASIKVEDTSMDLINVKREPEDDNITSNLNCFFESKSGNMSAGGVIDTGQLTDDELFTNFTKDKHLALHPVSLHHNESQHLETLSELSAASTSTSNLSQDLSQHSTNNDDQFIMSTGKITWTSLEHQSASSSLIPPLYSLNEYHSFMCPICGIGFSLKQYLNDHINGKHFYPRCKCVCGETFRWRTQLSRHRVKCPAVLLQENSSFSMV